MKELKYQQQQDEQEYIDANQNDVTGRDEVIPEAEMHLVHVEYYTPQYNRDTGAAEHKIQRNTFYYDEFYRMEKEGAFKGMKVTIIHMPNNPADEELRSAREEQRRLKARIEDEGRAAGDGVKNPTENSSSKSISTMNKAELTELYTELYGGAPDQSVTVGELKELIRERQDEK